MSFSNIDFGRMKQDLELKLSSCLRPKGRSLSCSLILCTQRKVEVYFVLFLWSSRVNPTFMCKLARLYAASVLQLETNFSR